MRARALIVPAIGIVGAVEGVAYANYVNPPTTQFAEGVEGQTSLTFSDGAVIDAPISQVIIPNAPIDTHVPGIEGLHTAVNQLQLDISNPRAMSEYVGLLTNFHDGVVKPLSEDIFSHLALGAGIGAAIGTGLAYGGLRYAKHVRQDNADTLQDIERLKGEGTETGKLSAERQEKKLARDARWRKRAAIFAGVLVLAGVGKTIETAVNVEKASDAPGTPLNPSLADQVPELEGTRISGGGDQINSAIVAINNLKENADEPWQEGFDNVVPALDKYFATDGKEFVNNPDIVAVAHVTDLHCNLSNYANYFGKMLPLLKPDIVAVTGDTQTNSGTMFYEKSCIPTLEDIVSQAGIDNDKGTTLVFEDGNHDGEEALTNSDRIFYVEGDNGVANVPLPSLAGTKPSMTFVGEDDPTHTIWYPTTPEDTTEQNQGLADQGEIIAKKSCKEQEDGKTVVAMSHEAAGSYQTILKGCASLVLNGHTHTEQPTYAYKGENGRTVLQHTGGSASGAGTKLSLYEAPEQDASSSVFYYSRSQDKFVGYVTVTLHTDSTVSVNYADLSKPPANPEQETNMREFLNSYANPLVSSFMGAGTAAISVASK